MGDLDDAIREHLELKRRRGADPSEVARQEQEALSPVTRSHAVVAPPGPVEEYVPAPPAPPAPARPAVAPAQPPRRAPEPPREDFAPRAEPAYRDRPPRPPEPPPAAPEGIRVPPPPAPEGIRVPPPPPLEDPGDETQEFQIEHSRRGEDWLEDDD